MHARAERELLQNKMLQVKIDKIKDDMPKNEDSTMVQNTQQSQASTQRKEIIIQDTPNPTRQVPSKKSPQKKKK